MQLTFRLELFLYLICVIRSLSNTQNDLEIDDRAMKDIASSHVVIVLLTELLLICDRFTTT